MPPLNPSAYSDPADAKVAAIYNDLANQLESSKQATQGIFNQGSAKVGQDYQQAGDAAQGQASGFLGTLADSAKRLGFGSGGLTEASSKMQDTLSSFLGRIAQERAGRVGGLDQVGTMMTSLAENRKAQAAQQGAHDRANILKAIQQAVMQYNSQIASGESQLKLANLKGELAIKQMQAQAAARAAAVKDNRDIALARLSLSEHASDRADSQAALQRALAMDKLGGGSKGRQQAFLQDAINRLGGPNANGAEVLNYIISNSPDLQSAGVGYNALRSAGQSGKDYTDKSGNTLLQSSQLHTPGGRNLDWGGLWSYINDYYSSGSGGNSDLLAQLFGS